ncbi:DUF1963 domain-containing protein [Pseudomonas alkylphenolica]|uniref:DUF1963 domain-containing protein n=1 Tax=Pseudomonas alkylphenolica TaxID=237609 RepID=UPI000FBC2E28
MRAHKIIPVVSDGSPFYFGGDSAYVSVWPKNPEGEDLLLLFTINCKAARLRLNRTDLPEDGVIHVFSTYDKDGYFLDLLTFDEVQQQKNVAAYTCVVHSKQKELIDSPVEAIPLQFADFKEVSFEESEICVSSLVSTVAPLGAMIPQELASGYEFFCQVYSSDFPAPFQDALYLTDAVGYLLVSKEFGGEKADGCFFVQVA